MYSRQVRFARWWGDIPFLPVAKPRPALQWLKNLTQGQHVLAGSCSTHVHSTSSAGRGSLSTTKHRQRRNANDGMHNYVRSEMSRVHRGPRTERREFASLEPLKDEDLSFSCDAVTSSSRTRSVGLEEVTVEWNRGIQCRQALQLSFKRRTLQQKQGKQTHGTAPALLELSR